jgi:hypothetical protein
MNLGVPFRQAHDVGEDSEDLIGWGVQEHFCSAVKLVHRVASFSVCRYRPGWRIDPFIAWGK